LECSFISFYNWLECSFISFYNWLECCITGVYLTINDNKFGNAGLKSENYIKKI
jgi:hypothetical protein